MQKEGFFQSGIFQIVKGVGIALLCAVALTAVYALVLRALPMGAIAVTIVTQVLKGLALAVGVILSVRGEKGWLKGGATGLAFCMLGYLTFASLGGSFALSWLILLELVVFATVGALMGVVAVNVKKG